MFVYYIHCINHPLTNFHRSTSDTPEHIVDNPTYGENESPDHHTHDGDEVYSRTGSDYETVDREPNSEEGYISLEEVTILRFEGLAQSHDQASIDSVPI